MDTIVFGNYTIQDLIIAAVVVMALFFLWKTIKKFFAKDKSKAYAQAVKCHSCGWEGKVSKYAGKCPQCNSSLGDQLGK